MRILSYQIPYSKFIGVIACKRLPLWPVREIEMLPSRTTDGDNLTGELRIQRPPLFGIPNVVRIAFLFLFIFIDFQFFYSFISSLSISNISFLIFLFINFYSFLSSSFVLFIA